MERMWTDAGKEFKSGTMTQEKMDKLIYCSIEKDGFKCANEDTKGLIDPELEPLKLSLYQCPKCDKVDNWTIIAQHIPEAHTDNDGVYE